MNQRQAIKIFQSDDPEQYRGSTLIRAERKMVSCVIRSYKKTAKAAKIMSAGMAELGSALDRLATHISDGTRN